MARNPNQHPRLFDIDTTETRTPRVQGDGVPYGQEFPFTSYGGATAEPTETDSISQDAEKDSQPAPEVSYGVAISLARRLELLEEISRLYGEVNRARGMGTAVHNPGLSQDLHRRYKDPDSVADAMAAKTTPHDDTIEMLIAELTQEKALLKSGLGYDRVHVAAAETATRIRNSFGTDTKAPDRKRALRGARKTDVVLKKRAEK